MDNDNGIDLEKSADNLTIIRANFEGRVRATNGLIFVMNNVTLRNGKLAIHALQVIP